MTPPEPRETRFLSSYAGGGYVAPVMLESLGASGLGGLSLMHGVLNVSDENKKSAGTARGVADERDPSARTSPASEAVSLLVLDPVGPKR